MPDLPERPSFENLRKQAKGLLARLREDDLGVTLTDAQNQLAADYGYRGWAALKAEVERRRQEGDIADAGVAVEVARAFDLGEVTGPMTLAQRHFREQIWSLTTSGGRWMPKEVAAWFDSDGERDVQLQMAALQDGLCLPRPLRSARGAVIEMVEGSRWRMFEWIDFGPPPLPSQRQKLARGVGVALARLHKLAIPASPPGNWLTSRPTAGHWEPLVELARQIRPAWLDTFEAAVPGFVELAETVPAELPGDSILCHSDLGPYNVRPGAGGDGPVLVGWEFTGGQPAAWEFGYTVNQWATGRRAADIAHALAAGYRAGGGQVPEGMEMFGSAVPAALNWIRNRVSDALQAAKGSEARRIGEREIAHLGQEPFTLRKLETLCHAVTNDPGSY